MNTLIYSELQDSDLFSLLLIRHFERLLLTLFGEGKLHGTTHTCLGQEYIPVSLSTLFTEYDFLFSHHRGHGHYLARFRDPASLLAEIMGRTGALCNGIGGSQHLFRDHYLSTGVQGENLPVAVGVALHAKREERGGIAVVYLGDGTWGEGTTYEALNIAQLWQVPLLVVVENNGIAQSTPTSIQMAGTIEERVRAFHIDYVKVTSLDIPTIRTEVAPRIHHVRTLCAPLVIEFVTHRLGPHSKGDDTRDQETLRAIQENDWYGLYQRRFPDQLERIEQDVRHELADVIAQVEQRPLVQWSCTDE
ncbi:thiamine pyrophosphate-dependent dehydrogenase E1 component subunit alpha [Dictyobacter aurantiacus]|uniref:Dehydrogenase n=1 Tax=Dictyobacter aurantiacus TaxID=1936993 RepID=A0A401ZLE7_9CHLR|nr:thiamine pyrophosphate-dependent dehydrogenase E1 component subunit alpha [Dictyobacter aurantiacus]GCE07675.1 dehydrogenase [Dictyobacter aurantiacus]